MTRLLSSLISLIILITAVFFLARALPGGPAYAILGLRATPDAVGAVNMALGLNNPVWRQYLIWWAHLLHGDLGTSFLLNRPVTVLLAEYAGNSALLYAAGLGAAACLAVASGLVHGLCWKSWPGRAIGALEIAFYALPGFFLGTVLIAIFSGWLGWLPSSGMSNLRLQHPGLADTARHLILPVATIMLFGFAPLSRYFAEGVHAERESDYARAAAARGLPPWRIVVRHVLRNALRPFVTMLGLSFPAVISTTLVVETVFGYPGLGWLLWRAALRQDYPMVLGVVLVAGLVTMAANLMADLTNRWLDPRLR